MKFFLFCFFTSIAHAHFDAKTSLLARSYPGIGSSLALDIGYNFSLYGQKENILYYGLLRPSIIHYESIVVRDTQYKLSFYPLKNIEFSYGKQEYLSHYEKFSYYDCDEVRCTGTMSKNYSRVQLALGAKHIFITGSYTYYRNKYSYKENLDDLPVAEYDYGLMTNPKKEVQVRRAYISGINFENKRLGIIFQEDQFLESDTFSQMRIFFLENSWNKLKVTNAIGDFESSHQEKNFIYIFKLSWIFEKSENMI